MKRAVSRSTNGRIIVTLGVLANIAAGAALVVSRSHLGVCWIAALWLALAVWGWLRVGYWSRGVVASIMLAVSVTLGAITVWWLSGPAYGELEPVDPAALILIYAAALIAPLGLRCLLPAQPLTSARTLFRAEGLILALLFLVAAACLVASRILLV